MGGGPEVELIAAGAAGEAMGELPLDIDGEARRPDRRAVRQGTGSAELRTASPRGTEGQSFQDPAHGDLGAEGRVVDRQEVGRRHG